MYKAAPDGYCGDEDNGQTSAWYVFSAMGFYPVTPGSNEYVLGAPLFKKATLQLESGKMLLIFASGNSRDNRYVKRVTLNDNNIFRKLEHTALMSGGMLNFEMSFLPVAHSESHPPALPYSLSLEHLYPVNSSGINTKE
jgi:putative alpha-1,2-mannosidase